jgi:hypothetical protein
MAGFFIAGRWGQTPISFANWGLSPKAWSTTDHSPPTTLSGGLSSRGQTPCGVCPHLPRKVQAKKNRPEGRSFSLRAELLSSGGSVSSSRSSRSSSRSGSSSVGSGSSSSVSSSRCWSSSVSGWSSSRSCSFWGSYWSSWGFFFFRASSQSNSQQGGDQQGFFHLFSLINSQKLITCCDE